MIWFALLACSTKTQPAEGLPEVVLRFGEHALTVEIVSNEEQRATGLMHRQSLDEDRGMLFVYPDQAVRRFWMKNTFIPLSIAFIDRKGKIVTISEMEPHNKTPVSSFVPAMYAVEANAGWFDARNISHGETVEGIPEDLEAK